jgi:arylsulfatase A-like enzyme
VQSHDAYPTILQAAGIDWTPQPVHTCRSLLGPPPAEPRWAVSEYLAPYVIGIAQTAAVYTHPDYSRFLRQLRAIQTGRTKLIRSSDGDTALYDLASDPGEKRNIADQRPETVADLSGKLDTWLESFDHYESPPMTDDQLKTLTPQQLKALRSLGYVK